MVVVIDFGMIVIVIVIVVMIEMVGLGDEMMLDIEIVRVRAIAIGDVFEVVREICINCIDVMISMISMISMIVGIRMNCELNCIK